MPNLPPSQSAKITLRHHKEGEFNTINNSKLIIDITVDNAQCLTLELAPHVAYAFFARGQDMLREIGAAHSGAEENYAKGVTTAAIAVGSAADD